MKAIFIIAFYFVGFFGFSQEEFKPIASDSLYRENQFYVSLNYNLGQHKPTDYSQNSFSTGLSFGFLRDMPITENRHWAIAAGLGYAYNNIKHNLAIKTFNNESAYFIDNDYNKNKLSLHYVELPLEIRWRNSTIESHKFWRIYTGFKASYLFASKSVFASNTENFSIKNNKDLNKFQYGPYMSFGYNTFNFYAFYALNPLFENSNTSNGENIELNFINIGFMFYIL
jgi:hypothetical protein